MTISVSVIASSTQVVAGIPQFVSITCNDTSATIFYTLDGSIPSASSTIYTGQFALPTNQPTVILNVIAIDGSSSSPVMTFTYQPSFLNANVRAPHSGTDVAVNAPPTNDPYPFGTPPLQPQGHFLGPSAAGYTTDDPSLPQYSTGYDAFGNPDGYVNIQPIGVPQEGQLTIYSTTDKEGQQGPGIGTFPRYSIVPPIAPPEISTVGSTTFDPRALVVYHDLTQPQDPGLPPFIHREHFTLEDVDHTRQGNQYFNTGLDSPPVSGTFLRQHYNPKDNTMNYYYLDTWQLRWVIVKTPAPNNAITNYWSDVKPRPGGGVGQIYQWCLFKANYLY